MRPVQNDDRRRPDARQQDRGDRPFAPMQRPQRLCRIGNLLGALADGLARVRGNRFANRLGDCRVCGAFSLPLFDKALADIVGLALAFLWLDGSGVRSRHGFRLPQRDEGDQPRKAAGSGLARVAAPAGAILEVGDERRRRFANDLVMAAFALAAPAKTRLAGAGAPLLRKSEGRLTGPNRFIVEARTLLALGRGQSDMRGHSRTLLTPISSSHEDDDDPRERRTKRSAAPKAA
jgi:hypothetical protein